MQVEANVLSQARYLRSFVLVDLNCKGAFCGVVKHIGVAIFVLKYFVNLLHFLLVLFEVGGTNIDVHFNNERSVVSAGVQGGLVEGVISRVYVVLDFSTLLEH